MDQAYRLGVIIKEEFYYVKISELPTEIFSTDPPWVGHPQQRKKVSFNEYDDGQMIIISEASGNVQEINKIGEIPGHLLDIMKKETLA